MRLAAGWPLPRRWRLLISWLVAIGLILWLLAQACPEYPRRVDLPGVRSSLRLGNPAWLVAALLSVVATLVLRVGRWRWLLSGATGGRPAWAPLWRATLWGQGLNMLLPLSWPRSCSIWPGWARPSCSSSFFRGQGWPL
ncbi:MAG: hypothetical protein P8186_12255 [Anaerolineae bacterium]